MIGAIAPYITRIRRSYQSNDIIDRLNYQYTAMMISLSAITLAATQYVGKPIQCWVPPEFTGAWKSKYAETYCFVKGSYFLAADEEIDDSYSQREKTFIGYYQWVPLVLAAQAMLFYLPSFIWKALNFNTGINVKSVLNSAALVKKKFDKGTRTVQVQKAATHLVEALDMQKELKLVTTFFLTRLGKRNGVFLTILYLFTKFLYVANVVLQFAILNAFLGPQYTFWGVGILSDIWNGREQYPSLDCSMCSYDKHVQREDFHFLLFWFILVGVLSLMSFFYWFFAALVPGQQRGYVEKYLRCTGAISNYPSHREQRLVDDFIRKFLRPDGVFLLRLIQTNGGDLLVGEIVTSLFVRYRSKLEEQSGSQAITLPESPDLTKL
uniref:Innexin n=1 Tax=Ditylenchus dipsaci TaxID=166011 RepID=A0A915D005_9BILA